jgi:hypothetical protein
VERLVAVPNPLGDRALIADFGFQIFDSANRSVVAIIPQSAFHIPHSKTRIPHSAIRDLRNGGFQTWHGHLAREKGAIPHEMSQGITGKMPVPRYFASPPAIAQVVFSLASVWRRPHRKRVEVWGWKSGGKDK